MYIQQTFFRFYDASGKMSQVDITDAVPGANDIRFAMAPQPHATLAEAVRIEFYTTNVVGAKIVLFTLPTVNDLSADISNDSSPARSVLEIRGQVPNLLRQSDVDLPEERIVEYMLRAELASPQSGHPRELTIALKASPTAGWERLFFAPRIMSSHGYSYEPAWLHGDEKAIAIRAAENPLSVFIRHDSSGKFSWALRRTLEAGPSRGGKRSSWQRFCYPRTVGGILEPPDAAVAPEYLHLLDPRGHGKMRGDVVLTQDLSPTASVPASLPMMWTVEAAVSARELVGWWNDDVAGPLHQSLQRAENGKAFSLLPTFTPLPDLILPLRWYFTWTKEKGRRWVKTNLADPVNSLPGPGMAVFGGFRTHESTALNLPVTLGFSLEVRPDPKGGNPGSPASKISTGIWMGDPTLCFNLGWTNATPPDQGLATHRVRIGSVDLNITGGNSGQDATKIFIRPRADLPYATVRAELSLLATDLQVAGEDAAPIDAQQDAFQAPETQNQRLRTFVIPYEWKSPPAGPVAPTTALSVQEWLGLEEPHGLRIKTGFFKNDAAVPGQSNPVPNFQPVILVKPRPFVFVKVEPPALRVDSSGEASKEYGIYTASADEPAAWRFVVEALDGRYVMPPMGVGEAMEKSRGDVPEDIGEGRLADFRFTPNALLPVDTAYFEQNFHQALWNYDRNFGYPGQRDAGAYLNRALLEMLYGMACEVNAPFVKLVEIAARLGAFVQPPLLDLPWETRQDDQASAFIFWRDWLQRQRASVQSRLGLLEMVDAREELQTRIDARDKDKLQGGAASGKLPRGFLLKERLRFYLRDLPTRNSDGVFPSDGKPRLRYPVQVTPELGSTLDSYAHHDNQSGLAGGAGWGYFDAESYEALRANPHSSSGELSDVYISSLGIWGTQKARFDNDRVIVESRFTMGRLHYYSLEFVGRIGVHHHKAKLVVVYERTVAPSKQFKDQQNPHRGRPLLRLTSVSIHFLQPERAYPDADQGLATDSGPVRAIKCPTIIPVDIAWKEDVYRGVGEGRKKVGWKVPLWKSDPAQFGYLTQEQQDAFNEIYPKPAISVTLAAEAAQPDMPAEERVIPCELDNPEDVYFYFEFAKEDEFGRPLTADTDRWPQRLGVDWDILPVDDLLPVANPAGPYPPDLESAQPEPHETPAGLRPFTLRLGPSRRRSNLMEGRSSEALAARVRTITMMRSREQTVGDPTAVERFNLPAKVLSMASQGLPTALKNLRTAATLPTLETVRGWVQADLKSINDKIDQVTQVEQGVNSWFANVDDFWHRSVLGPLKSLMEELCAADDRGLRALANRLLFNPALDALETAKADLKTARERLIQRFDLLRHDTEANWPPLQDRAQALSGVPFARAREIVEKQTGPVLAIMADLPSKVNQAGADARTHAIAACAATTQILAQLVTIPPVSGSDDLKAAINGLRTDIEAQQARLLQNDSLAAVAAQIGNIAKSAEAKLLAALNTPRQKLMEVFAPVQKLHDDMDDAYAKYQDRLSKASDAELSTVIDAVSRDIETLRTGFGQKVTDLCATLQASLTLIHAPPFFQAARDQLNDLLKLPTDLAQAPGRIEAALRAALAGNPTVVSVTQAVTDLQHTLRDEIMPMADALAGEIKDVVTKGASLAAAGAGLARAADDKLQALRAFCDAPEIHPLKFNRQSLAFLYKEGSKALGMTPVVARFKGLEDQLDALGLRLPTQKILDGFMPEITGFDLGRVFSNVGGMNFGQLFPALRVPDGLNDRVKVSHGFDKETLSVWAKAVVDAPLSGENCLFSFGPVGVYLRDAQLSSLFQFKADADGRVEKVAQGEVRGSWDVRVGGTSLVTFADTSLHYDQGKLSFNLNPAKIQLNELLQMVSDLLASFSGDSGLVIGLLLEGSIPVGAKATLDLALPPIASGTFSITGLRLGAYFGLRALDANFKPEFTLATGFNIGRQDAPFNMAIFILGGAGWCEVDTLYTPGRGELQANVNIGIALSASLAVSLFGVIEGIVSIFLGVKAEFHTVSGQPASFSIGVVLLFSGDVSVKGIIRIMLSLMLEAKYHAGGGGGSSLVGTGTLTLKIKICWCFTLKISKSVSYSFGAGGGGSATIALPPSGLAEDAPDPAEPQDWETLLAEAQAEVRRRHCVLV